MSTTQSPSPLSVIPFIAADAGLLLTAGLIGWGTQGELTGGPLLAVVSCVGLGAVAMVYPFIVNDAHQRDAALAERQRELAELVTASNAHASRWGTQWAAAATGLEDAAALASRSIAAAERLPMVFQQTAEALTLKLTEAEQLAQARAEHAAQQESALAAQLGAQLAAQLEQQAGQFASLAAVSGAQDSALAAREAALTHHSAKLDGQLTTLTGQLAALTGQVERNATQESALAAREASVASQMATFADQFAALTAQVAPIGTAAVEFKTTLQEFARLEVNVREHRAAIAASLSEFPVAAEQARSARSELQDALTAAPVKLAAEVEQQVSVAEVRLGATTAALTERLAEVEAAVAGLVAQLNRVAEVAAAAPLALAPALVAAAPVQQAPVEQAPEAVVAIAAVEEVVPVVITPEVEPVEAVQEPVIVVAPAVAPAPVEVAAVVQAPAEVTTATPAPKAAPGAPTAAAKTPIRSESIMDPFIIPKNGYAALADAMDLGDA